MKVIKHVLAIARKDFKIFVKDRGALAVFFLMPLLFALIFGGPSRLAGGMADPDSADAPVISAYVVNEDTGPYGAQVAAALRGIRMLRLQRLPTVERADEKVADGEAPAAIIIPADFSAKIDANQPTKVRIIQDPTQQEEAALVAVTVNTALAEISVRAEIEYGIRAVWEKTGALEGADPESVRAAQAQTLGAIWSTVQEMRQNPLIGVRSENLAGETTESEAQPNAFSYFMPMFATMFAFFLVGNMAESILKEKEAGSFRRLLAAPIHRASLIAGKMVAYMVVVCLQMVVMLGVGNLLFDMPLGRAPLGLVLLTLGVALASTALGMLVGALARTSKQASMIGLVLGFVLMGAAGFTPGASIAARPTEGFQYYLAQATPHVHAFDGYVKLMVDEVGVADILPNLGVLIAFAVVFFLVAMRRFKFD